MKLVMIVLGLVMLTGCSIAQKSWASAGSCDAFKVVISDAQSGNPVPTIIAGGGAHCMGFQKPFKQDEKVPPIITYSRRKSMWGLFSSDINAGNVSFVYIAGSEEKPEDTYKILLGVAKVVNTNVKDLEEELEKIKAKEEKNE